MNIKNVSTIQGDLFAFGNDHILNQATIVKLDDHNGNILEVSQLFDNNESSLVNDLVLTENGLVLAGAYDSDAAFIKLDSTNRFRCDIGVFNGEGRESSISTEYFLYQVPFERSTYSLTSSSITSSFDITPSDTLQCKGWLIN